MYISHGAEEGRQLEQECCHEYELTAGAPLRALLPFLTAGDTNAGTLRFFLLRRETELNGRAVIAFAILFPLLAFSAISRETVFDFVLLRIQHMHLRGEEGDGEEYED